MSAFPTSLEGKKIHRREGGIEVQSLPQGETAAAVDRIWMWRAIDVVALSGSLMLAHSMIKISSLLPLHRWKQLASSKQLDAHRGWGKVAGTANTGSLVPANPQAPGLGSLWQGFV